MIARPLEKSLAKGSAYRPDIDGLRSIAVLSVVAYHFSGDLLPGGFLGVDVFFVISGFLIAGIIHREVGMGNFSILRFYERRVRRIAPALLFVLAVSSFVAALVLLPIDLAGYGASQIAALFFVANIYFWRDGNYFAQSSETKPLLHTWSLGVEEQFYIFFPLILILFARKPRFLLGLMLGTVIASYVANVVTLYRGMSLPAFYLLPTRWWELAIGASIAMSGFMVPDRIKAAAALAGIGAILASFMSKTGFMPQPIPAPTLAVLGAAAIIASGSRERDFIGALLESRPAIFIGLISYSMYLWHWPIYVFAAYYWIDPLPPYLLVAAFAATVGLAWLSWRYVERPFRSKSVPPRTIFLLSGAGALALASVGLWFHQSRGLPERFDQDVSRLSSVVGTHYRCDLTDTEIYDGIRSCRLTGEASADADVLLVGNSHAQMYAPIIADFTQKSGRSAAMLPINGCPPFIVDQADTQCNNRVEALISAAVKHRSAEQVILAFNWDIEDRYAEFGSTEGWQDRLLKGLDTTVTKLEEAGKTVILVGPIVTPKYEVSSFAARRKAFGHRGAEDVGVERAQFDQRFAAMIEASQRSMGERLILPHTVQCSSSTCMFIDDGSALFSDGSHIAKGALGRFAAVFSQALQPEEGQAR